MFSKALLTTAIAISGALAADQSVCDKYTTALLKNNTAANQLTLVTLLVNTAVIGNYTQPNVGVAVPGILAANATYNGTPVNLAKYFDGSLASTNRGGEAVKVSFLTGGGAAPLEMDKPANDTTSPQYTLLTHLYSYVGTLLGCTEIGTPDYPAYTGSSSMYEVHKFMKLDPNEVGYFIEQVGLSAASFGVSDEDVKAAGTALNSLFGYRCAPKTVVIPTQPADYQSICIEPDCPLAANSTCPAYNMGNATYPMSPTASGSPMPSSTMTPYKGAAVNNKAGVFAGAAALLGAFAFML